MPSQEMKQNKVDNTLSKEIIQELKEAFAMFDKTGDGTITTTDLNTVMSSLGQAASDTEIKDIIKQVDLNGNGKIEFEEFLSMMTKHQSMQPEDITQAFRMFDKNRDGFIDAKELRNLMSNLGEQLTEQQICDMIADVDINGDGKVDYTEFVAMLRPMITTSNHSPDVKK